MNDKLLTIETPGSKAGALRVEFPRIDDRYHHRVFLVRDGEPQLLLTSVEGTPEEYWPSSPPLQQLSIEDRGDLQVALAVGMAGSSHWSMSVESSLTRLTFDYACRCREEPEWLGTTYAIAPGARPLFQVTPMSVTQQEATVTPDVAEQDDTLQITIPPVTGTAQWKYTIQFAEGQLASPKGSQPKS